MRMIRFDRRLATAALVVLLVVLASMTVHPIPAFAAASGSQAVQTAPLVAASTDPTIVKLVGDGQLQVSSPDDDSLVVVEFRLSSASIAVSSDHPLIATAPCVADPDEVLCPANRVHSVLVLTSAGNDTVLTRVPVPVVVVTGGGNDAVFNDSPATSLILLGDGDDTVRLSQQGANDVFGGAGRDEVRYVFPVPFTADLEISLDDLANDGPRPVIMADNIHSDIENLNGGAGNDILFGSDNANVIIGGGGSDVILGLGGDDTIAGDGPSPPDFGADFIDGGAGTDTVSYSERFGPVIASLDGLANDGQSGEQDNIVNAENLIGGRGNDTLTGNAARNVIRGGPGDDLLRGGAGDDTLSGDEGTDIADGGAGTDLCTAERVRSC